MADLIGQQIDQYLVQDLIGQGGMATVYLALDVNLQRPVALKVLRQELTYDPTFATRFQREAQSLAKLQHPHIVRVYATGKLTTGQPYLAMQYIDGGSLHDRLKQLAEQNDVMPTTTALTLARQIAEGLTAAHAAGIVHRDLKPGNILLRRDGTPVITDLGIAAVLNQTTHLTQTGAIIGTPYYMSPEQIGAGRDVDGRSDIYALGVILHEMLTGRTPFVADSPLAVLHQHLHEPPPDPGLIRRDLAQATLHTVATCLQKKPEDRFPTAAACAQALQYAYEVESNLAPTVKSPLPRSRLRRPHWLLLLLPLLFLMISGGYWWWQSRPRPDSLAATRTETAVPGDNVELETVADAGAVAAVLLTATPTSALPPTQTLAPTATIAPSATPTPIPTETPVPTATPTNTLAAQPLPIPANVSPTGRIVFTCFIDDVDNLCAINADGSGETRLTDVDATDFYASVAPDGSQILFSSRRSGSYLMYGINLDGSNPQIVGPTHLGHIYAPALSPDGRHIVFVAAAGRSQHIWLLERSSGNLRQLTETGANNVDPVWSPDGSEIAFASDREGQLGHFIVNLASGEIRKVETDVANLGGRSDWSPDGRWLAIYAGPRGQRQIYLVAIDGSTTHQLTHSRGDDLGPSFSPDGNWITFTSYRDGDAEIFIMRSDGSVPRQLTFNNRPDWQPRWGP